MLGKLIKHEWKDTYKMGSLILLCILLVTVIGCISALVPTLIWGRSEALDITMGVISVFGFLVFVFGLVGISYGILIYLGVHFYKSMYGDEGYLVHTLPVTSNQLFLSKILVGGSWMLITMLAISLSVVAIATAFIAMVFGGTAEITELVREIKRLFEGGMDAETFRILISMPMTLVVGTFVSVATLYGSITLGQLFHRHRGIMAILCYMGVKFVTGIIAMLISIISTTFLSIQEEMNGYVVTMSDTSPQIYLNWAVTLVIAVALYCVACHIDSKKLNME